MGMSEFDGGVLVVQTAHTVYEFDLAGRQVRRMHSTHEPTPRQGCDGEWRQYCHIDLTTDGRLLIIWRFEDGVAKSTLTSQVQDAEQLSELEVHELGLHR